MLTAPSATRPSYWDNPTPQKVFECARCWENTKGAASQHTWVYHEAFPILGTFVGKTTYSIRTWKDWFDEELENAHEEGRTYWDEFTLDYKIEDPVVFVPNPRPEFSHRQNLEIPDIWDGWHRIASCFVYGRTHLRAIVGTPIL